MSSVPPAAADKIYSVIDSMFGPLPDYASRADFIRCVAEPDFREFRFQGSLAFGGKFYSSDGKWYVRCYPEDITHKRLFEIEVANTLLTKIKTGAE